MIAGCVESVVEVEDKLAPHLPWPLASTHLSRLRYRVYDLPPRISIFDSYLALSRCSDPITLPRTAHTWLYWYHRG
jgi:hypothetical protein